MKGGGAEMTTREALDEVLQDLPEDRVTEILDFARFLSWQEERETWRQSGRAQLARAYGPNEPDYTLEDLKPELDS
jgi:hypothetical protein